MEATVLAPTAVDAPTSSKARTRLGMGITALPVAFLLFDAAIKLVKIQPVIESFEKLGYSPQISRGIGALEALGLLVYLVPRTAALGAVLLTGYLGGAVATHVRVSDPLFSHSLFPVYVGILLWAGLALRDRRIAALGATMMGRTR
jgi:hypothetical protein